MSPTPDYPEPPRYPPPGPQPHFRWGSLVPWVAMLVTVGHLVWSAGRSAAMLDAATNANASSLERHEAQEKELDNLDDRVDYLCQARARDDREAGRTPDPNAC